MKRKTLRIDKYLCMLRGYDMEMDRKVSEAFENLARTRDCVTHQLAAEEMTLETMAECIKAEARIYEDFARDLLDIMDEVTQCVDTITEYRANELKSRKKVS